MNRILLTGATGLTGSHIAEYFAGMGTDVTCLVRKGSNTRLLDSLNLPIIYGDITDKESLKNSLNNKFDYIIHTAAKVSDWGKYDDFYKINVTGTLNVLEAAFTNRIRNVIITGSISCYGEESSKEIKDENSEYKPHYSYFLDKLFPSSMNYYRDTKAESNRQAIKFAEERSMNLTIIEPGWIYGEREFHSGFYDFLKSLKSGISVVPGTRKNKFHAIYARDLAKLYYLAYQKGLAGINKFLGVAPRAELQYKLLDLFCRYAGFKLPRRIPKYIIYPPALLLEFVYSLFRANHPPPISRARVNIFYDNIEYSYNKSREILGFEPDYSLEQGIKNTVQWYKENNYL